MTEVYAERCGRRCLIAARGHADGVESCNYITGVLYTFAGYAHNAAEVETFKMDAAQGAMTVRARGGAGLGAVFEAAVIGLRQLERTRPQAVRVTVRDGAEKIF